MKKQVFCAFLALVFLPLSLFANGFLSLQEQEFVKEKHRLKVFVQKDLYAYTYSHGVQYNGYALEYLLRLAELLGFGVEVLKGLSQKEAQKLFAQKKLDVLLHSTNKEAQAHQSRFPVGILTPALLSQNIYQSTPSLKSSEELRVAVVKNSLFASLLTTKYPEIEQVLVENMQEALEKVQNQESDFALGLQEYFQTRIEFERLENLQTTSLQKEVDFPVISLSLEASSQELLGLLNKAMQHINFRQLNTLREHFFASPLLRQTNIEPNLEAKERLYLMQKQLLRVCSVAKNLPYDDILYNKYEGMGANFVALLEKSLDTPVKLFPVQSMQEARQALKKRECDFISLATKNEALQGLRYTKSLLEVPLVAITENDTLFIETFERVAHKRFSIQKNDPMKPFLQKRYKDIRLVEVNTGIEGVKAVERGEVFAFLTTLYHVSHIFKNHIADNLQVSAILSHKRAFSFALLEENTLLTNILEKSIHTSLLPKQKEVIQAWVSERYPKGFDYTMVLQLVVVFVVFSIITFKLYVEVSLQNERLAQSKASLARFNAALESRVEEELKRNRQKDMLMYRQNRFASMGEMIGNIAHQWRQPLMELSAQLMQMQAALKFNPELKKAELVESIRHSNGVIRFMSHTIDDFKNFFAPQKKESAFLVEEVIESALEIMGSALKHHNIKVNITNKEQELVAFGLKNEFAQVLINLLSNAKDVLIEREVQEAFIQINTFLEKEWVVVEVRDNAGGIHAKNINKIFEPFFTEGKKAGMGVGLFMSKMIIENHMKGTLSASNDALGAVFVVRVKKALLPSVKNM